MKVNINHQLFEIESQKNKIKRDAADTLRDRNGESFGHWFSLIVGLKTLPDKGLTENTKLKKLFPS